MEKYKVRSGSLNITVQARNHKMAVFKAIEESNVKSFGLLIGCLKHGDSKDEELFSQTEGVLKEMGFEVSREKTNEEDSKSATKEATKNYIDFMKSKGHQILVTETYNTGTGDIDAMRFEIKLRGINR